MLLRCLLILLVLQIPEPDGACEFSSDDLLIYESVIRYKLVESANYHRGTCDMYRQDSENLKDPDQRESAQILFELFCSTDYFSEYRVSLNGCDPPTDFLSRIDTPHGELHRASEDTADSVCTLNCGPISRRDNQAAVNVHVDCKEHDYGGGYLLQDLGGLWLVVEGPKRVTK